MIQRFTLVHRARRANPLLMLLLGAVMSLPLAAQNPLQPLIRPNQTLALPTTVARIKTALGRAYDTFEREDFETNPSGWGNRYVWQFPNGLMLTAQSDGQTRKATEADSVRAFLLTAPRGRRVSSLRGLVLNKTTKAVCQARFKSALKRSRAALLQGQRAYFVPEKDVYTYLIFNAKGVLTKLWQTSFDLETAG